MYRGREYNNQDTIASFSTNVLDRKIMRFIREEVLPAVVGKESINEGETKKLEKILYYSIGLDIYTRKRCEMLDVISGKKAQGSMSILPTSVLKKFEKTISLSKPKSTIMGSVVKVNTKSKYATHLYSTKEREGLAKCMEDSAIKMLENMVNKENLKNLLKGESHLRTVLKLREFIKNGGDIQALDTESSSFKFLVDYVEELKDRISHDNYYFDFNYDENGEIVCTPNPYAKRDYNARYEKESILKDHLRAYKKESLFMTMGLLRLYGDKMLGPLENGVDGILTSSEYSRMLKLLGEHYAPEYIYGLEDIDYSPEGIQDFENQMLLTLEDMNLTRTNPEDYLPKLQTIFNRVTNEYRKRENEKKSIIEMSNKEINERRNKIQMDAGIPVASAALTGLFSTMLSFSYISPDVGLVALASSVALTSVTAIGGAIYKNMANAELDNLVYTRQVLREREGYREEKVTQQPIRKSDSLQYETTAQIVSTQPERLDTEALKDSTNPDTSSPHRRRRRRINNNLNSHDDSFDEM